MHVDVVVYVAYVEGTLQPLERGYPPSPIPHLPRVVCLTPPNYYYIKIGILYITNVDR